MARVEIERDQFPSNSQKNQVKKEKEMPKSVVKGTVKKRKPSEFEKAARGFFADDIKNVGSYIIQDVLIPAAKDMLFEMITGSASMSLFGDIRGGRKRSSTGSRVNYGGFFRGEEKKRSVQERLNSFDMDELQYESRTDASEVLDGMMDILEEYEHVTVADCYRLSGEDIYPHTAHKFGWTSLSGADIQRVYGGMYILKLPRPKPLD